MEKREKLLIFNRAWSVMSVATGVLDFKKLNAQSKLKSTNFKTRNNNPVERFE
jgi:hypothetical protein